MAYDSNTYGTSPFGQTAKRPPKPKRSPLSANTDLDPAEALSDQGSELRSPDAVSADDIPALPAGYAPVLKSRSRSLSRVYIPKGRISGLNLLGESLGWLMAWGTVGFFRAYVPPPIVTLFDHLFSPWGMAALTLTSALLIGQLLKRYQLKLEALRLMATTALEYGSANHQADTQNEIFDGLTQAEAQTEALSRWLVSWLTALGCLFIIGAFY